MNKVSQLVTIPDPTPTCLQFLGEGKKLVLNNKNGPISILGIQQVNDALLSWGPESEYLGLSLSFWYLVI